MDPRSSAAADHDAFFEALTQPQASSLQTVQNLLERRPALGLACQDDKKFTGLMIALQHPGTLSPEVLIPLLLRHSDALAVNIYGRTALHVVVCAAPLFCVNLLLDPKALLIADNEKITPLAEAIKLNRVEVVDSLLSMSMSEDLSRKDARGMDALSWAVDIALQWNKPQDLDRLARCCKAEQIETIFEKIEQRDLWFSNNKERLLPRLHARLEQLALADALQPAGSLTPSHANPLTVPDRASSIEEASATPLPTSDPLRTATPLARPASTPKRRL